MQVSRFYLLLAFIVIAPHLSSKFGTGVFIAFLLWSVVYAAKGN